MHMADVIRPIAGPLCRSGFAHPPVRYRSRCDTNMSKAALPIPLCQPSDAGAWLSAIIDSSTDAILSKTLDGIITSWNAGAEHLFGFSPEEAIGQPITIIIPDDRLHEEESIISRLRAGQRIDRFETVRRTRAGEMIPIEVTISPVRDDNGTIIGASKIARGIAERLQHSEKQALLLQEMQHRIKNLLSIVQGLIGAGRRRAQDVDHFADELQGRVSALAAAQQLILQAEGEREDCTLGSVLASVLAPFEDDRVTFEAADLPVGDNALTSLALLFHELATNAVKYGALTNPEGRMNVAFAFKPDMVCINWTEEGGQPPDETHQGFGTELLRAALRGLEGSIDRSWLGNRLELRVDINTSALQR